MQPLLRVIIADCKVRAQRLLTHATRVMFGKYNMSTCMLVPAVQNNNAAKVWGVMLDTFSFMP